MIFNNSNDFFGTLKILFKTKYKRVNYFSKSKQCYQPCYTGSHQALDALTIQLLRNDPLSTVWRAGPSSSFSSKITQQYISSSSNNKFLIAVNASSSSDPHMILA